MVGAAYHSVGTTVTYTDSSFLRNKQLNPMSPSGGGALFFLSENGALIRCQFIDNEDVSKYNGGGAIVMEAGSPTLYMTACTFTGNKCKGKGGAIYLSTYALFGSLYFFYLLLLSPGFCLL